MRVNILRPWPRRKGRKKGVLDRMMGYLSVLDGWAISEELDPDADVNYIFDPSDRWKTEHAPWEKYRNWDGPLACFFTHREEYGIKRWLWTEAAQTVGLRVSQSLKYLPDLRVFGPSERVTLPVERDRFIQHSPRIRDVYTVGVSGYNSRSGRKGAQLVYEMSRYPLSKGWRLKAAGRNWPIPTKMYDWADMPRFYQSLDVYWCPSLLEGGPLGVFEALACGIPVVIPAGVGCLNELPNTPGVYRYPRGSFDRAFLALALAKSKGYDSLVLRNLTKTMTPQQFRADHVRIFEEHFGCR